MSVSVAPSPIEIKTTAKLRIESIDLIRGAVMILMAIDHVRVFSGVPAGGPSPGIFFTRWITHFCAPAFIFLAGTSIFLYARKHTDVSRFLLIRGVLLIFLELTLLRLAWTFNLDFRHYEMAGVIWVIGCCMILMAALVKRIASTLDDEFDIQPVKQVLDLFLGINSHVRREVIAHEIGYPVGKDRQVARSVVLSSEKEAMRLEGIQAIRRVDHHVPTWR